MGKPIDIKTNTPNIPSEEEIKQLPRWAQVAFAARCARRVQPLFTACWPDAPQKHINAVEQAITMTEKAYAYATADLADAAYTATAAAAAYPIAADAAYAAYSAAYAVVAVEAETTTTKAAAAVSEAYAAVKKIGSKELESWALAGIRRDFDTLVQLSKKKKWNDDAPVRPEVFGPMWPDGEPDWKKIAQEHKNLSKKEKAPERNKGIRYDDIVNENLPEDTIPHFNLSRIIFNGNTLFTDEQLLANLPDTYASTEGIRDFTGLKMIAAVPGTEQEVSALSIQGFVQYILSLYQGKQYTGTYIYVPREVFEADGALSQGILPVQILETEEYKERTSGELENNYKLREEFIDFLINDKNVPESAINPSQGTAGIKGRKPLSFTSIADENHNKIAIIDFPILKGNKGIKKSNEKARQYLADSKPKNSSAYIVCRSKYSKDYPFDIYQVTDTDKPELISYEDFPSYNQLLENIKPNSRRGTIATMASDKPGVEDLLGRTLLAQSLAKMFVHTKDIEGLTVALLGEWGEGKSTVMNLVENELEKESFEFAKFNAWEYEHTDNIAAGLAQEVLRGLLEF